jgi:hypothetical protein
MLLGVWAARLASLDAYIFILSAFGLAAPLNRIDCHQANNLRNPSWRLASFSVGGCVVLTR